ncbi:tautomerase family protein [Rhizosaccharibacter radicis]|uniref:Tautomerase family protein n=1 Tax=Rhizosaccharibacter radicis TaxID=2782605 RepID=A0ABT1W0S0_9PROT|nr:tautomerase family protein [Acetobacteraceae bacterium KSS12]
MCVVRVSLLRGRSPQELSILSKAIDDALVESYAMESGDTFQVFEQLDASEFVFDRHFKVGPRSDGFLMLNIVGGPKPDEVKRAFYRRLVDLLGERANVRPEDLFVGLQEAPGINWSFGLGTSLL